jgi:myo-inositol-1(or 4)-monophosphatase
VPTEPRSTEPPIIDPSLDDGELAVALVIEAGQLAARMRAEGLETRYKTSISDVVTAADISAEEFVVAALRRARPGDGIVGEEGTDLPGRSGRTWVIDPVDGTYNFLSGLAYWCSAVALRDRHGVLLGAVSQPSSQETWLGGRDLPTTLNGRPVQPLVDRPLAEVSLATYLHPTTVGDPDALSSFLTVLAGAATPRMMGSGSVDLAGVAGGRIGAWAQHSCPDWDWLPGQALVEGAGGRTVVLQHGHHRWHLAGNAVAVADLVDRLKTA